MNILVIEDNPIILEFLVFVLEENGHTVHQAQDGSVGVGKFKKFDPDLVITDLVTPRTSGAGVIEYIREEEMKSTPIIVLSALDLEYSKREAFDLGANEYIVKPFKSYEILEAVRRYEPIAIEE